MATIRKRAKPAVPRFQTAEDEADFWEKHSPLDFPDEWLEAKRSSVTRPLGHVLAVRLDAITIDRLSDIGRAKGIGPSTLARMWLLERLAHEAPLTTDTAGTAIQKRAHRTAS